MFGIRDCVCCFSAPIRSTDLLTLNCIERDRTWYLCDCEIGSSEGAHALRQQDVVKKYDSSNPLSINERKSKEEEFTKPLYHTFTNNDVFYNNTVQIAGDATCVNYAGWLQGAYYSGLHSINKIFNQENIPLNDRPQTTYNCGTSPSPPGQGNVLKTARGF